ncbi:MAG: glycosyltransferase [Pseudomonadales bacterium]|nr:glycosyltransferase [Pseudomonadales bacterium]MBO7004769.1 glycosyltransferase [Pseudomonadales bacterium]
MADLEPKLSIITATFNSAATITSCLDSIAEQTYGSIQHIVVDGASSDGTQDVVKNHSHQPDVFQSEPDAGVYDGLNKGIQLANGEVIGFLHSDDMYASSQTLQQVADCFDDTSIHAVYGDLEYVAQDDTDRVIRRWIAGNYSARQLTLGWMPPHPTLFVRREWYERVGNFDIGYKIAADYHFILRLFNQPEFVARYLPQVLVKMRVGGVSNRSLPLIARKSREDLDALRKTGAGGVFTLLSKNIRKINQFFH